MAIFRNAMILIYVDFKIYIIVTESHLQGVSIKFVLYKL